MQKKRKIIISIAISLGLALAATQISHDGGLKASIFGNLESCKNGTIKYIDTCEKPLKQEQVRIQAQINTLTTQITAKQKQCNAFTKQKKTAQAKKCRTQLAHLNTNKTTQQKILSSITTSLAQLVPRPVRVPVIITPANPTNPGCMDSTATNYDPAYDADDGSCIYDTCLDSTAQNYLQKSPCIYYTTTVSGCTNPGAQNYNIYAIVDDGSCSFTPEIREGCVNSEAHNYESGANQDNGSCQTCSDNKKNGDEEDVDCGGNKCSECAIGCKDPNATNYSPEAKKEGPCTYDVIIDTPQYYCDVPEAVNYESEAPEGDNYMASASACNFCGNGTKDGDVDSEGRPKPKTFTGDSGTTVEVAEECDDGDNDKSYDGCSMCRIETCGDEVALCQAYKFTGGEGESELSSKLKKGIPDNSASKRPEWNNHRVDAVTSRGRDFATFGSICIRNKDEGVTSYTGYSTIGSRLANS